mgnify:CR=1 FL=1
MGATFEKFKATAKEIGLDSPKAQKIVDLAVEMRWNFFQGRKLMQLGLVDWRLSER